jgi:O-acetyl-ADP-ribose deacetylase (regulator of RNase III)
MIQAKLEIAIGVREFALRSGDITKVVADAIGNAANSKLVGGGGVDGAIHRAGGPSIMQELDVIRARIGCCRPGSAVATQAGELPARWVLHAVGPVYKGGLHGEAALLASCYRRCLVLAEELGARSLTLPAISTGVYGYPLDEAADISVRTVAGILAAVETKVQRVTFVLFGDSAFRAFARASLEIVPQLA